MRPRAFAKTTSVAARTREDAGTGTRTRTGFPPRDFKSLNLSCHAITCVERKVSTYERVCKPEQRRIAVWLPIWLPIGGSWRNPIARNAQAGVTSQRSAPAARSAYPRRSASASCSCLRASLPTTRRRQASRRQTDADALRLHGRLLTLASYASNCAQRHTFRESRRDERFGRTGFAVNLAEVKRYRGALSLAGLCHAHNVPFDANTPDGRKAAPFVPGGRA
jgi:hypothetical protein